jgi:glycosyltransferase involved in cell wall biosynthesis
MNASIGVVIPTYERCDLTVRAVLSVLNQTHKATQIVVIDDGSDTATFLELREKLSRYPVQLEAIPHTGNPGYVRKFGISLLRTDYVSFLDSDDYWLSNKLETQVRIAQTRGFRAICSNALIQDDDGLKGNYFQEKKGSITLNKLLLNNSIICSSVLVDRKLILECDGFASSPSVQGAEDYATWLRVAQHENWSYIDEPLIAYSVENIGHFSHSRDSHAEIQALTDFALWQRSSDGKFPILFRLAVRFLKISLMSIGRR